jgi:phage tail sheath protein FI
VPVMKTPGVYIVEKNAFPNSVVEVATAVPAFIGYTELASNKGKSLRNVPWWNRLVLPRTRSPSRRSNSSTTLLLVLGRTEPVAVHIRQLLVKGTLQRAEEQAAESPPHSVGCDLPATSRPSASWAT